MIISDKKATRYHTQRHNRQLVFTTIYRHAPISRAGIRKVSSQKERSRSVAATSCLITCQMVRIVLFLYLRLTEARAALRLSGWP